MTDDNPSQILVLDRNRNNLTLLTRFLEQQGYQVLPTISLEEGAQALDQNSIINLALVDISGFDASIWALCQQFREREIPFLVISPRQQAAIQQASIVNGALGLLAKPLAMRDLARLIQELLKGVR